MVSHGNSKRLPFFLAACVVSAVAVSAVAVRYSSFGGGSRDDLCLYSGVSLKIGNYPC